MKTKEEFSYSHRALQIMACTLNEFNYRDLRELYEVCRLPITPLERAARTWVDKEVVMGEPPRRYSYYNEIRIDPKAWPDVMQTVSPKELEKLLYKCKACKQPVPEHMPLFLKTFCCAMHGEPFEDDLKRVPWPIMFSKAPLVKHILYEMAHRQDCLKFMAHLPGVELQKIYFNDFVSEWMTLNPADDLDVVRELFFDNTFLEEKRRFLMRDAYLYHVEFVKTGKLVEVMQKMAPESEYYGRMQALQKLHEGDAAGALQLLHGQLLAHDGSLFVDALTNFAYALALGQTITAPPSEKVASGLRKKAETLMKSRAVQSVESGYVLRLVLHHYLVGDAEKFYKANSIDGLTDKMCMRLSALFLRHYQIHQKEPVDVSAAADYVMNGDSDYLRLLYSFDYDKMQTLSPQLQQQTGLKTSLMPKVKRKEPWEWAMAELLKLNRPATAKDTEQTPPLEVERVAYVVNLNNYNVQPKLQKSKDGGITWTKGRNIALKSFSTSQSSYMTAQDSKVGRMVRKSYGWYGKESYELYGIKVIAALAGHPCVFDAYTDQRIDITEEPLQLTVQPCRNGFSVISNADLDNLDSSGICLTKEGDRQVTIVRVNNKQEQTLSLFSDIKVWPKESKAQLTQLLQNLSSSFTVMSPLLKNATDLKHVEASSLIAVQIAPVAAGNRNVADASAGQLFSIALAVKPFANAVEDMKTPSPYQQPGQGMEVVSTKIKGERVQTERDMKAEKRNLQTVRKIMQPFEHEETDENRWQIDTRQCLQLLDALRQIQNSAFVEWPQGVRMRVVRPMITPDKLRLKISSAGQWFEVEGDINIGDKEKLKIAELLEKLRQAEGNFIRLNDDEYVALSEQLRRQLEVIDKTIMNTNRQLSGSNAKLKVAAINGLQLEDLEEIGAKVKADEAYKQLVSRVRESADKTFAVPANIHAKLRPYQQEGFEWMSRLAYWGAGACLADDMGLGKTLQAITLMQSRASLGPALVLMPTSVLHNWQQELQRFAPALTVKILNQQGADRQQLVGEAEAGDVVLSTYGLLVTEGDLLSGRTWSTIVLDEAHTIKNRDTQTSKAAMTLQADFRLMLTGTPMQNHLSEIWNLFQFANPGLLGSFQQFTDRFIVPIERDHNQQRQRLLRRLLSPFLLRRTKDDVLSELPEKTEITLRVELSPEEQALYDNMRQQAIANIEEGSKSALQTLAEITRLRQAACHPRLINDKLQIPSSKTAAFLNLVEELHQSGHRALVFSQFTSHLALIREALDNSSVFANDSGKSAYLYLDGSTSPAERNRLVRQFQTGDQPLFLISLKAGGLGLNLTAADYVIHLDPWWNPAIEDQASDRAHRIGQKRPVTVYRLIAAGTIEEKIIRLHQNKRSMADALLQDADMHAQISAEDVVRLLREGVDAMTLPE